MRLVPGGHVCAEQITRVFKRAAAQSTRVAQTKSTVCVLEVEKHG
jgi:hypothetical protein